MHQRLSTITPEVQPSCNKQHLNCAIKSVFLPGLTNTSHQKKHQPRNRPCDVISHIIWKSFETKVCNSPETPSFVKLIASKYDLNQQNSRVHDNCPIVCEICSKLFNNRQPFATHKIIKHFTNSQKILLRVRLYICQQTPFPGTHGDHLTGITSKSTIFVKSIICQLKSR